MVAIDWLVLRSSHSIMSLFRAIELPCIFASFTLFASFGFCEYKKMGNKAIEFLFWKNLINNSEKLLST
jgi:hypothetical protein